MGKQLCLFLNCTWDVFYKLINGQTFYSVSFKIYLTLSEYFPFSQAFQKTYVACKRHDCSAFCPFKNCSTENYKCYPVIKPMLPFYADERLTYNYRSRQFCFSEVTDRSSYYGAMFDSSALRFQIVSRDFQLADPLTTEAGYCFARMLVHLPLEQSCLL